MAWEDETEVIVYDLRQMAARQSATGNDDKSVILTMAARMIELVADRDMWKRRAELRTAQLPSPN